MSTSVDARSVFLRLRQFAPDIVFYGLIFALAVWVAASRIFDLQAVPPGLFFDESSIGYNAIRILETGADEHGVRYPVYFESVGDYKNPLFIYAVALVFGVLGASEFTLRFTSVLFFGLALLFSTLLIRRMFGANRILTVYSLLAFGCTPLFFTVSRVAFEVITQWALVSVATLTIYRAFHEKGEDKSGLFPAALGGLLLGLSTYSYTTQRLLSGLTLIVLWAVFLNRQTVGKLLVFSASYSAALIPFLVFSVNNPGLVTERFLELSFVDDSLPAFEKASIFIGNYAAYWSPDFLIFHGDPNLRHSTGFGGVFFISTVVLFALGLLSALIHNRRERFAIFLLANLALSPAAASMITEGTPHALRSMLMGYYVLLISCYAVERLAGATPQRPLKGIVFSLLYLVFIVEAARYQRDYFVSYPARSVEAFDSFDFKSAVEFALEQQPREIAAVGLPPGGYAHVQFYSEIVENAGDVPIVPGEFREPAPGVCILFHRRTEIEGRLEAYSLPYERFSSRKKLSPMETLLGMEKFGGVMRVRCY